MRQPIDRTVLAADIAEARRSLTSDLSALDDARWAAPSLCDRWSVRDVAGHLLHQYDIYRRPYRLLALVPAGFRINQWLAEEAARYAAGRSSAELLESLRTAAYEEAIYWRTTPWPEFALTEWVVRAQDIRRPLGLATGPSMSHLAFAADVFVGRRGRPSPLRRVFQRKLPAVRLQATDHDWSHGDGPLVRGPLEAIVMVLVGRRQALADLSGEAVASLGEALATSI